jgi:hypothetical protein
MAKEKKKPKGPRAPLEGFLQHQARAARHVGKALAGLVPQEARAHGRAAAKEWLLSIQVLIDGASQALEREGPANSPSEPASKVKVEVQ